MPPAIVDDLVDTRSGAVTPECDLIVIVPPGGQFAIPFLAPASLQAYVQRFGYKTDVLDMNVTAVMDVVKNADELFLRLEQNAPDLLVQFADDPKVQHQINYFLNMSRDSRASFAALGDSLRDPERFRHQTAYTATKHKFFQLASLANLAYYPFLFLPRTNVSGVFSRLRDWSEWLSVPTPYDRSITEQIELINWEQYRVIGISAFSFDQVVFSLRFLTELRKRSPDAIYVLGGNCLSESHISNALLMQLAQMFDLVVVGDGELPLLRTIEFARGTRSRAEIPNAVHLEDSRCRPSRVPNLKWSALCHVNRQL